MSSIMNRMSVLGVCVLLLAAHVEADDQHRGFTVDLRNCSELIGFGPVSQAAVAPLVPSGYTVVTFGPGTAGIVVRASRCEQAGLDDSPVRPVIVSQVGVAILSPDGSGDINNYQLFYVTNDDDLAQALGRTGVPALVDREMAYEFTPDQTGHSGGLYVGVSPPGSPAYFETGNWNDPPPNSGAPVVANWWFNGPRGVVKMSTSIGSISYGPAALTVHTSKFSLLGTLLGGNTGSNFAFFNARGLFAAGQLDVAVE
jgi:hypothetical protein